MEDDQRFAFGGWLVHSRKSSRSRRQGGRPIWGSYPRRDRGVASENVPTHGNSARIHMRYDRTTPDGAYQQRQLEILWRSRTSGVEEAASQGGGRQDVERGLEESEEFWCTYCGWPLDNSSEESDEDDARVPVPCAHGGFVHTRCMLERAENLARGHTDPRPCVARRSAWPVGSRPPHPAELARGIHGRT